MTLLLLYLALALGVSFLCSVLEAVLLSVTPAYVSLLERQGGAAGVRLRRLRTDIDRPLSALLSLNTIAHTVGAAGVGAQAQAVFGNQYVAAASAILTLLILVFSEIIPKTLGATYWRGFAPVSAWLLRAMVVGLYPLVLMALAITRLLARDRDAPSFSREEFHAMAELGAEEGLFRSDEFRIFRNLLRFGALQARDVLTPRVVVAAFDERSTVREAFAQLERRRFSRLPVYHGDREAVTGYVLLNDVLMAVAEDQHERRLSELRREVLRVPATVSLRDLFEQFLERREHMAVVVDEYGGLTGLVTIEDVVETLLGLEIMDETDHTQDMRDLARRQWLQRAKRLGVVEPDSEIDRLRGTNVRPHAGR